MLHFADGRNSPLKLISAKNSCSGETDMNRLFCHFFTNSVLTVSVLLV